MEAKFRIGEKVKIANHPDKSKIGKEVEIINLHHSNFNPQKAPSLAYRKNHVQQAGQWSYTKLGGGEFGLTLRTPNRLYGSL